MSSKEDLSNTITFIISKKRDKDDTDNDNNDEDYIPPPKKKARTTRKKLDIHLKNPQPVHCLGDLITQLETYVMEKNKSKGKETITKRRKGIRTTASKIKDVKELLSPLKELDRMIGLDNVKTQIVNQLLLYLQNLDDKNMFLHTVITGNPGVGKTSLCKILAKIYKCMGILPQEKITNVDRSQLIGQWLGETSQKTKRVLTNSLGGILLIDEAYALGNKEGRDSFSKECLDCINQFLSENVGDLICILAGYKNELDQCFFAHNPGLKRRFPWKFDLPDYTPKQLTEIFFHQLKQQKWKTKFSIEECEPLFNEYKAYFPGNGGDTQNLFDKTKICHARRVFGQNKKIKKILTLSDLEKGLLHQKGLKSEKDFPSHLYL